MTRTGGAAWLIWCFGPDQDLVACNSSSGSGALVLSVSTQMQFFSHIIVEVVVECIERGLRSESGRRGRDVFLLSSRMEEVWGLGTGPPKNSHSCNLHRCVTTTRRALRMEK